MPYKNTLLCLIVCLSATFGFAQSKTENVFIITLDGYRWQELYTGADPLLIKNDKYVKDAEYLSQMFWHDDPLKRREMLMPFFWNTISKQGQLYGNRAMGNKVDCSNSMWFSYPGYNEILTGYADDERITSNDKIENPNITLLEHLNKQPSFKGKVAAFGSWDVFPYIINEARSGVPVNAGFESSTDGNLSDKEVFLNQLQKEIPSPWGGVRLDAFTHHYALAYLEKNLPSVLYIAYGETDDFAHGGDYSAYLKSANRTDQFISDLWDWTQSHEKYKGKTTFIITTDHGRGTQPLDTWRSHGSKVKGGGEIWFAAIGPDTKPLGEVKSQQQLYQNQVAATVAALLKVDYTNARKVGDKVDTMISK